MAEEEKNEGVELVGDSEQKSAEAAKAEKQSRQFSRRQVIGGIAAGIVGGALVGSGITNVVKDNTFNDDSPTGAAYTRIELNNAQQYYDLDYPSGIVDASQRYCVFAMFDMREGATRTDLQLLLARWTAAIATMQSGKTLGKIRPDFSESSVPKDMGETADLDPCSLTITTGFGRACSTSASVWKISSPSTSTSLSGIASPTSAWCSRRRAATSACRSAPTTARLSSMRFTLWPVLPAVRRSLPSCRKASCPIRQSSDQPTPRDLFGFRDGTTNPTEDQEFEDFLWVKDTKQEWLKNGSFMCYGRTIADVETWESDRISDQEQLIGRRKDTGAPLSNPNGDEFDIPDLNARDANGDLLIDPNSHVAITSDQRLGFKVLRRSYNYWSGLNDHGDQNAGFLNCTYVNDPYRYWLLRDDMGRYDRLNEYYYDDFRGVYAVPHAPATGTYLGQEFFE